ncbi:MAG: type II secretion system secretin GspD [Gammaproteobacteria bacterium]
MTRHLRLLPALLLGLAAPAWGATTLNLKDADINTLITTVSEVTGRNFIVDERVKGKVTVISSRPMSSEAVYETFLAVLAVKGYAAVPAGSVIKIVQDSTARQEGGAALSDGAGRPDDDVVTHVFQIENVSAAQLVPILRPLVPQWGHLVSYGPSNMLIISDRAANVVRLGRIIEQIDRTGDREVELVKLVNAGAADVVRILGALIQQTKSADPAVPPATVIADERSNSVLIGGDKSERQKLLDIISQLDVPLTEDGSTQVIYLRYASAENLAPILEGYAQQADAAARPAGAPGAPAPAGGGGGDGRTRIIADKDTNALVITGSPKAIKAIRNVIAQLDIRRSQVLVEAVIAEVSAAKSAQLGIDWFVFNENRIAAAGILDPNTLTLVGTVAGSALGAPTAAATTNPLTTGLTMAGGIDNRPGGTSIGAILKALQGDTDTNVLSTPSVVATDNEESELSVGQELSISTGSFTTTTGGTGGATGNPFQTTQRKDVGLKLGVTPQINEGDTVALKLNLEVSQLQGDPTSLNPVTSKRTLNTTVTVTSGQVLVLGGLIDDQVITTDNSIPFLSRIPLLGALFQFNKVEKIKRNLVLFIRPAILRDVGEADYYTRRKYDAARDAQIDQRNRPRQSVLPRGPLPVLPKYEEFKTQGGAPPAAVPPATAPMAAPAEPAPAVETAPPAGEPPPAPSPAPEGEAPAMPPDEPPSEDASPQL